MEEVERVGRGVSEVTELEMHLLNALEHCSGLYARQRLGERLHGLVGFFGLTDRRTGN